MPHPYYGSWENLEDVRHSFRNHDWSVRKQDPIPKGIKVLFAVYGGRAYEGAAMLLYQWGSKLYYNYGSHCSCNGLEECWSPEEVTPEVAVKLVTAQLFGSGMDDGQYNEEYEDDARAGWLRVAVSLGHGHLLADYAEFVLKHMAQGEHHA